MKDFPLYYYVPGEDDQRRIVIRAFDACDARGIFRVMTEAGEVPGLAPSDA